MPSWWNLKRKDIPPAKEREPHSTNSVKDRAEFSLRSFGLSLLQQQCAQAPKQNVFISPLSIFLALAMIENGAAGETKAAIRKVLAVPADANEEAVHKSTAALLKLLQSQGEAELSTANSVWADVRSTIRPDFVRICQEIYGGTAQTLDLSHPSSVTTINNWVAKKTKGKIPSIVTLEDITGASAVLTNAVYFKGKFRIPFQTEATRPQPFYLADGREKVVAMMREVSLPDSYRSGERFEAAVLRYKNSKIVLYLLLPARGTSPEQILTDESMQELLVSKPINLDLFMPRFTLDFSGSLKKSLAQLGMGIAFQYPGADFSALGSTLFFLGEVMHKTCLEVDEEGTVAAAATSVMMDECSAMPLRVETKTLVFDRPFAVLLRDTTTSAIIFDGVVYEP